MITEAHIGSLRNRLWWDRNLCTVSTLVHPVRMPNAHTVTGEPDNGALW